MIKNMLRYFIKNSKLEPVAKFDLRASSGQRHLEYLEKGSNSVFLFCLMVNAGWLYSYLQFEIEHFLLQYIVYKNGVIKS